MPDDYKCELGSPNDSGKSGCGKKDTCTQTGSVDEVRDALFIQLKIYSYVNGIKTKIFPAIQVNEKLDELSLQGIIWHHGDKMDTGHYTAMVKHDGIWYHTNDQNIYDYPVNRVYTIVTYWKTLPGDTVVPAVRGFSLFISNCLFPC